MENSFSHKDPVYISLASFWKPEDNCIINSLHLKVVVIIYLFIESLCAFLNGEEVHAGELVKDARVHVSADLCLGACVEVRGQSLGSALTFHLI